MRSIIASALAVIFLAPTAPAANRLDQLFAAWEKAQAGVQSLVIDYTVETIVGGETVRGKGSFRLLRKADGTVCATDAPTMDQRGTTNRDRVTYLLNNGSVYELNHGKKQASRLHGGGDLAPFLERWFNPLVILLDRKRAKKITAWKS